jgi:hypothetical protein
MENSLWRKNALVHIVTDIQYKHPILKGT